MLLNIEAICPGLKTENGISVQGQDCYPLRTSVGLLGEQPINKDPKTGGYIYFLSSIVSDGLQSEHFASIQLPSSELQLNFSTRSCGLVGNFSREILF